MKATPLFPDAFYEMLGDSDDLKNDWICADCVQELLEERFLPWLVHWKTTRKYFSSNPPSLVSLLIPSFQADIYSPKTAGTSLFLAFI